MARVVRMRVMRGAREREREVGRNNEPEKAGDVNVLSYRE